MKSKGCGPYNLGAPKSPAKQVKKPVNPNLSESENKAIGEGQISDDKAQKLKGKRGSQFRQLYTDLQAQQRAEDSTYIVNNRTIKDAEPYVGPQGTVSSTILTNSGKPRPSQFKRDKYGKMGKY